MLTDRDLEDLQQRDDAHVMATYGRQPVAFIRGDGTALFDTQGRAHLDFLSGLAVTSLGHAHPEVADAIAAQARTLVHTSNLYLTVPMLDLAERLARITAWPDARTFLCNSGAEANEAAIKLARRWGKERSDDKVRLVTLEGSFHGRTLATLEATGQPGKHAPFAPLAGFVDTVPHDDAEALDAAVTNRTCAVLLEVIQGEGGVRPVPIDVLDAARKACDEHSALLIVDEVQTGVGRTGNWFAFQGTEIVPDVITVAKALGNGVPIGACIARGAAATVLGRGDHATTFGGNPLACAAAMRVLDIIERDGLVTAAAQKGERLREGVAKLVADGLATGVRGAGLLLAVTLPEPIAAEVEVACRERFLIVNAVAPDAIRLAPPLTVDGDEIDLALAVLRDALTSVRADHEDEEGSDDD